ACYTLTVYDSFGDGMCCAFGEGSYVLTVGGVEMAAGGEFVDSESTTFCTDGSVAGCTDSAACNYNENAVIDDGSCNYDCGVGCTDPVACNYNPEATEDDGSCTYDDGITDCDGNCYNDADGDGICDEDEVPDGSFTELTFELVGFNTVGTMNTYRVYANFTDPTDQLVAVFGFDEFPLELNADMGFYQDPLGGPTSALVNPDLFDAFPDLEYDTWLTVGGEDNTASVNQVGIDFSTFEDGGNLLVNDFTGGSVYIYPDLEPTAFPDVDGRVLIGQFTSDGEMSMLVNLQYRRADGSNPQVTGLLLEFPDTPPCPGDWNNDGLISISDMLLVLSEFGCSEGCNYDMTNDGGVTTSDILQMLALFGTTCPE
ncbi:MAG: dockerin type I domain-containing protein, partial [Flavobacteriales bacterium]|nr:dockerin type I domain-containing protein [Flavobacteriales bacterium]